jgi:hypothetical protein
MHHGHPARTPSPVDPSKSARMPWRDAPDEPIQAHPRAVRGPPITREDPAMPTDPHAETVRRITRARLAAALARLQAVAAASDFDRLARFDRLAILREIRATRAALDNLREEGRA